MMKRKSDIEQIISLMESVIDDTSVPKNIRKSVSDAKAKLQTDEEVIVRASGAVYALNEVSEDINMPIHARTQIWTILSALESIKEQ
ncbi:MAG: UPF0147 family protein [Candidatus Micrarchaeota archaeon]|nr:UPF0147 family protein [Candidatus Micrarchaeota archaeon]